MAKMIWWLVLALVAASPAVAQTPFRPVAVVNSSAITGFDLAQRAQIMVAMGFPAASPDALRAQALDQLVEDRLKIQEAERLGLKPTPELITAGLEEFASRANISVAEFKTLMNTQGVTNQALDDLVGAEVVWREVIRGRFARRVEPGEAEIDAEIALAANRDTAAFRVLEIGLPFADGGRTEAQTRALADQLYAQLSAGGDFAAAVSRHSRAPSAARGGEVGWVSAERMPSPLVKELSGLEIGQITRPLPVAGGISILKLIERRSTGAKPDPTNPELRARVREQLVTDQSLRLADGLLQELRRDALIDVR